MRNYFNTKKLPEEKVGNSMNLSEILPSTLEDVARQSINIALQVYTSNKQWFTELSGNKVDPLIFALETFLNKEEIYDIIQVTKDNMYLNRKIKEFHKKIGYDGKAFYQN